MEKINFKSRFLFVVIFIVTPFLYAQITTKEIDSLVSLSMQKMKVVGVAVAIVKDGKVIHNKGYGFLSDETKQPVNQYTKFAIASNSKAFTSAALAILVDEGKINWDDKVKLYIPEFKMYNEYVTKAFTIRDLLTHRSGLPLGIGDLMIFPNGSDFTIDDILSSFQYFKPSTAFRTTFDYDNLLYFVAGELIKRVTGVNWEIFVEENIFNPLNMSCTYGGLSLIKDKTNLAKPHIFRNNKIEQVEFEELPMNGAPGGIISCVDDVSKWMLLHLNNGKYGDNFNKKIFSDTNQMEMWKIHTVLNNKPNARYKTHFRGYGLGWFLKDVNGNMLASHTGGLLGMLSKITLIPDLNLGVVVLTNTSDTGSGVFSAISNTIVDSYLGLDNKNWVDVYSSYYSNIEANKVITDVWDIVRLNKSKKIDYKKFIGNYKDNWFGNVSIFEKNGGLWFKSERSPKLNGQLYFYRETTFAVKWPINDLNTDTFVNFDLDGNGLAQSIKMKGISPNIDFSYDFHDLDLKRIKD
jgi:CubicO group peptidase (beta-lactamase class C family)